MPTFAFRWLTSLLVVCAALLAAETARAACCPVTTESCVARPGHANPACQAGTQQEVKAENVGGACDCCSILCLFDCTGCIIGPVSACTPVIAADSVTDGCNGVDDDCDGLVDEDFVTGPEVCDGIDNNCNGAVDEQFPFSVTCGAAGACAGSQTFTCVGGVPGATACVGVTQPTPEIPDGYDNDCDGETDECGPGDFWCNCNGGEVVFQVDRLDDGGDPEIEAANCLPGAQSTGQCRLRGVFRRAEQLDFVGCRAVAQLPTGTVTISDELRLRHGNLTVRGESACSSVITTESPCEKGDCRCGNGSPHRVVNAIRDGGSELSLTVDNVTLRGGRNNLEGDFSSYSAAGGIVIDDGDLTVRESVIEDNRARGQGAGIGSYHGGLLHIVDSVIRDNMNLQAVSPQFGECRATQVSGGLTGPGGGILTWDTASVIIENSAITGNVGPDGGGLAIFGGALTIANSTVSGNHAGGRAGGLMSEADTTTLAFTTFTKNGAGEYTGSNDRVGGGFRVATGTLVAYGNIFAQNFITVDETIPPPGKSPECSIAASVSVQAGTNLIGYGGHDCAALGSPSSPLIGPDPGGMPLGLSAELAALPSTACASPLTSVHATGASSPATGAYPASASPACPAQDQRHFGRNTGGTCTLGAYETNGVAPFRRLELTSCVHASQSLTVRDRAEIDADAFAGSYNASSEAALFGALFSTGNASLGPRATVEGDAALRGVLSGNTAGVLGDLFEGVAVPAQSLALRSVSAGGTNITVPHDTTMPLGAGSYGHVVVRSRATLRLTQSGSYRFQSLTFEPDALLDVSSSAQDVVLAVQGTVTFGDRFHMSVGGQSSANVPGIFVYSNGSRIELGHSAFLVGTLEAPSGTVELRDRSVVIGCAGGRNVTVGHDASVGDGAPSMLPVPPWPPG